MRSLYEFHLNCYHLETEKDRNDTMTNKQSIPPHLSNGEEVYKKISSKFPLYLNVCSHCKVGRIKGESAFEHVQNMQIQIILFIQ